MKPTSLRAKCDELSEMLQRVRNERDAAISRMEDLEADVRYYENHLQALTRGAFRRGAEAMREAILAMPAPEDEL